jgi:hypothetical protein
LFLRPSGAYLLVCLINIEEQTWPNGVFDIYNFAFAYVVKAVALNILLFDKMSY